MTRLAASRSLLAFDLDGTLAPLVAERAEASVPPIFAARLRALARLWPVAVITGRALADARPRLGFEPRFLFGNHGAERDGTAAAPALAARLDSLRERLERTRTKWHALGIDLEDKGLSLALHHRAATDPALARHWLDDFAESAPTDVLPSHGHAVLNLVPRHAPNKGDALLQALHEAESDCALFVGDDANDEPAFARVPAGSVGVRIGAEDAPTAAAYHLEEQRQVGVLLSMLLAMRAA